MRKKLYLYERNKTTNLTVSFFIQLTIVLYSSELVSLGSFISEYLNLFFQ